MNTRCDLDKFNKFKNSDIWTNLTYSETHTEDLLY